eukprot:scaffold104494_cov27-Phaeocystis_antarctica.AAC.1
MTAGAAARWPTAMDGELGARGRAAPRPPGRSAGCRGARPPLRCEHTSSFGRHSTCVPGPCRVVVRGCAVRRWLAGEQR